MEDVNTSEVRLHMERIKLSINNVFKNLDIIVFISIIIIIISCSISIK